MDLRTGRMYASREEALAAGVPESDIAECVQSPTLTKFLEDIPIVEFSKGPFKGRRYQRTDEGHLVKVKDR